MDVECNMKGNILVQEQQYLKSENIRLLFRHNLAGGIRGNNIIIGKGFSNWDPWMLEYLSKKRRD